MDPVIRKAEERLEWLSSDEETIKLYKAREEALIEKMSLIGEAEERGERNKAIKMAKEMIADGEDVIKIKKYTGLSDEDISEIKKDLH